MHKAIKNFSFLTLFLIAPFVSADSERAAQLVFEKFFDAFTKADTAGVVNLFSENALFWGTSSKTLTNDIEGIRAYFSELDNRSSGQLVARKIDISTFALNENIALVSGVWQVAPQEQAEGTLLRLSAVVMKQNNEWKITQFHNSKLPE